jgi:hypothetical protein
MVDRSDVPRYHLPTAWFTPYQIFIHLFTIFTNADHLLMRVQWRNNDLRDIIEKENVKLKLHFLFRHEFFSACGHYSSICHFLKFWYFLKK